jgi:hypothetical protein
LFLLLTRQNRQKPEFIDWFRNWSDSVIFFCKVPQCRDNHSSKTLNITGKKLQNPEFMNFKGIGFMPSYNHNHLIQIYCALRRYSHNIYGSTVWNSYYCRLKECFVNLTTGWMPLSGYRYYFLIDCCSTWIEIWK